MASVYTVASTKQSRFKYAPVEYISIPIGSSILRQLPRGSPGVIKTQARPIKSVNFDRLKLTTVPLATRNIFIGGGTHKSSRSKFPASLNDLVTRRSRCVALRFGSIRAQGSIKLRPFN